ncbi:MAG: ABC transporter permease [Actinomycetia bacterium]|nr:ABC transporter permease [Actinomycetes bacterium]
MTELVSPARSRLRPADGVRVGFVGLRTRPLRTLLTALGIAIGIASMISVVGISASSRADLLAEIDSLGTGLLRAAPGQSMFGDQSTLPETAKRTAGRIGPVTAAAGLTYTTATVRRSPYVDAGITGGIAVMAVDSNLLDTVRGSLASGRFLNQTSPDVPVVVLGADAAARLGITSLDRHPRVWITGGDGHGEWFAVIGIAAKTPLAPELDSAAMIGYGVADELYDTTASPSTLFVRADPDRVPDVRAVLARTVNPQSPNEVDISRPSDALEARAKTDAALRNLLLALGAVALLVGGVGITNVMVISVLERRAEIGVRRALGASRRHILTQFLAEAGLLSVLGGVAGCTLGAVVTAVYANSRGWVVDVPIAALAGGAGVALAVGLLAGVSPAIRAARLDPAEAIRPV